jgi:hypothetical protein
LVRYKLFMLSNLPNPKRSLIHVRYEAAR